MPDVTKRILTDETGQDIVSALAALTNVVDPNGTAVAAAAKLNNMTVAATSLTGGSSPTASLTTVDNHFHLSLGIPHEIPAVSATNNGQILKVDNGAWIVGAAPTGVPNVSATDNGKILQVHNGAWAAMMALPTAMVGATSENNGQAGLVPAPTTADVDKFLSGDGTYKSGGLPMVILEYGTSTWQDFMNAYRNNVIVYCRASSNANPGTGTKGRMAFMAYVGGTDPTNPTNVEFQYYRSMNPSNKSITQMSDQVYVYTLSSSGVWSVTAREAGIKQFLLDPDEASSATYDKNAGSITLRSGLPKVTSSNEGEILKVINGEWAADSADNVVSVSGTTPTIQGEAGTYYICGEVSTLTITPPATGIIDVIFSSGTTPTVLTVSPPSNLQMKWVNNFDTTALEADTIYEINILNGNLGVVGKWEA